jgi:hypothetical protein
VAGSNVGPVGKRERSLLAEGAGLHEAARGVLADHARALEAVRAALAPIHAELVGKELESIPVSRLKDVTEGRLRLGALETAGFASVRAVYEAGRYELRQLPGVGAQTADRALAAARQLARAVEETVSVRMDVDRPEPRTTALVIALRTLVEAGPELRRAVDAATRLDERLGALLPAASVAPAYLRRNQQDVLTELPALVEVDEWEEFSAADREAYLRAVEDGNFMAMRRAAYADAEKSAKLGRLRELVAEAAENGLKVVVFSYFRDVLALVRQALGEGVFGPVSGAVPAARRQRLVDDFTAAPGHAVLLCQIEAAGIGLNLQAASVVVLCEPQVKPTMEHQAVARAHRMGQVRPVQVHRLLATDSVDQRLLHILKNKSRLFDAYARRSDTAEQSPDAVDISDSALARRIVEEEQIRLAGGVGPGQGGAREP